MDSEETLVPGEAPELLEREAPLAVPALVE